MFSKYNDQRDDLCFYPNDNNSLTEETSFGLLWNTAEVVPCRIYITVRNDVMSISFNVALAH